MARYKQLSAGSSGWSEWETPIMRGYKLACCDCGLVHVLEFRVHKVKRRTGRLTWVGERAPGHKVEFRARVDKRATGQVRRRRQANGAAKEAAE